MRVIQSVFAAAVAAVALAASAQPAAADDPGAWHKTTYHDYSQGVTSTCDTPYRTGVHGQYGAWGSFIDGCTTRASCASFATRCKVTAYSRITSGVHNGQYVTLNTKLRRFYSSGAVIGWQDNSCGDANRCPAFLTAEIAPNQSVSNQCNGVRQTLANNTATVHCELIVQYLWS
jgi:hypothetical protein